MKDDLISRKEAIAALAELQTNRTSVNPTLIKAMRKVEGVPSAAIRCGECRFHRYDKDKVPYCSRLDYGYGWGCDDFCSWSEGSEE